MIGDFTKKESLKEKIELSAGLTPKEGENHHRIHLKRLFT